MGCPASKEEEPPIPEPKEPEPKKVDPRLPWKTYRQLFNMRNSWKTVARAMTKLSKEMLLQFFKRYPHHKNLHKKLVRFEDYDMMVESQAFENAALDIFNTIDEVMECSEDKVDFAISTLQRVGKVHGTIKGFHPDYFKDMEGVFFEFIKNLFGDRWNDPTEENFHLLWDFVIGTMVAAIPAYPDPPPPPPSAAPAKTEEAPAANGDAAAATEDAPAATEETPTSTEAVVETQPAASTADVVLTEKEEDNMV